MAQIKLIEQKTNGNFTVDEWFVEGKESAQTCEDGIVVTPNFAAVIDGATAKSFATFNGKTTGRIACELLCQCVSSLPSDITMSTGVELLTKSIHDFYVANNLLDSLDNHPEHRLTASGVIYSHARKEIWLVGDCQFMIDQKNYTNHKQIDDILARARSLVNEMAIMDGATIEQLQKHDLGREFITPVIKRQGALQNNPNPNQRYSFTVFDGFKIDPSKVVVVAVNSKNIVLASDGYPELFTSLQASEQRLQELLVQDPLCIGPNIGTKGIAAGNVSYDDRAYIKITIKTASKA